MLTSEGSRVVTRHRALDPGCCAWTKVATAVGRGGPPDGGDEADLGARV